MHRYYCFIALLLLLSSRVEAQNFIWSEKVGSSNFDLANSVSTDANGNCIVVGAFYQSVQIDTITLTSQGGQDHYIAKLDPQGDVIWAKGGVSSSNDEVRAVSVDTNTNEIYVIGSLTGQGIFGNDTLTPISFQSAYVAKLDPNGNYLWAKLLTSTASVLPGEIAVDLNGDLVVLSVFSGTISIGGVNYLSSGAPNTHDYLTVKFSSTGSVLWSKQLKTSSASAFWFGAKIGGVGILPNNEIVLSGHFRDSMRIESTTVFALGSSQFTTDIWLARLDQNGNLDWLEGGGGISTDFVYDLAVSANGNIFLTGRATGTFTFDTISVSSTSNSSVFVAQFDSAGGIVSVFLSGGNSINEGYGIDLDSKGHFYITGRYYSTIEFGSIVLSHGNNGSKLFIAKYDYINEEWEWAAGPDYTQSFSPAEEGRALTVDGEDNVFVAGIFSGTISLTDDILVTSGSYDGFITKLGDCSGLSAGISIAAGDTSLCSGESITFAADTSSVYEYQWIFNNAQLPGQINEQYTATQSGDYLVIVDSLGCKDSSEVFTVVANTSPSTSLASFSPICSSEPALSLTTGLPVGGVYSGTGVSGATFDPALSGTGTHPITYTYVDANGCADSATKTIQVKDSPFVFMLPVPSVCDGDASFALSAGIPPGGVYSGNGVTSGTTFNPSLAGVGTSTVYYTRTGTNGCASVDSVDVVVNPGPSVGLTAFADVCIATNFVSLNNGTPGGGTYSGTGVTGTFFFPLAAGPGSHDITYSLTQGGCTSDTTQTIYVDTVPAPEFATLPGFCDNQSPISLNPYVNFLGGAFSGPGVTDSIFDPQAVGVGSDTIVYTLLNSCGSDTAQEVYTVHPAPTVSLAPIGDLCLNAGVQTLVSGTPLGGNFSGPGVNAGSFDPAIAGAGTHAITYTFTDGNGCTDSAQQAITVNPLPSLSLSSFTNVCVDAGSFALSGGSPAGGNYFGTGVSGGNFDPATAGVGSHSIGYTYTDGNTCTDTVFQSITVDSLPTVTLATMANVCANAGSFFMAGGLPVGGTYSGVGVNAGTFDPASAGVGSHVITYSFTDGNGCTSSAQQTITVDSVPQVSISALANVCLNAGTLTLNNATPTGGIYTGAGVSGGTFDPAIAGVGQHWITYTFSDGNACTASDSTSITVDSLPSVALATIPSICLDGGITALTSGSPVGGTYFGTAVSGGNFDPATAGVGSFTIGYAFADGNGCADTAYNTIEVDSLPIVSLTPFSAICANAPSLALTGGMPLGGNYSGTGVLGTSFDPALAGAGSHSISYIFTDGNGCADSAQQNIDVDSVPVVSLSPLSDVCLNGGAVTLTQGTPVGGTYSGLGVSAGSFQPASAGAGSHLVTYIFTDGNGCTDSAQQSITVDTLPSVSFSSLNNRCVDASPLTLTGGSPIGGSYFGTGVAAGIFDAQVAGVGVHTLGYTFTDGNGCADTAFSNITVDSLPLVSFTNLSPVCQNGGITALAGGLPLGGVYSGNAVATGSFDPLVAGVGTHQVTYTFTDGNGCADSAQQTITVDSVPVVTLPAINDVCENGGLVALASGSPAGGIFSGVGVIGSDFDPAASGAGIFTITYSFTDGNGCTDSAQQTILVDTVPVVNLSALGNVCEDAPAIALAGGTPVGGMYFGTAVSVGNFDPSAAGVGSVQIGYTFLDGNGCTDTAFKTITVDSVPIVSLSAQPNVCENGGVVTLTGGSPLGGMYSGASIAGGDFDPALAGVGVETVTYTFTDGNGCVDSTQQTITVDSVPLVSLSTFQNVCLNEGSQSLAGGLPLGGVYSGAGVSSGSFDPLLAGIGQHLMTYTYVDGNGCIDSAQQTLEVDTLPVVSIPALSSVCIDAGTFALTGATPAGGSYFGTGVNAGMFDPQQAGVGTHTIGYTVTDGNTCTDTAFTSITVDSLPAVTLTSFANICENASSLALSGGLPLGGIFSGTGVNAGVFDPMLAGTGSHQVTYVFTDGNGCADSAQQMIGVDTVPIVTLSAFADVCIDTGLIALAGGIPAGGVYTGTGVSGGDFSAALAGDGTFPITYTFTDGNGCVESAQQNITVHPLPVVSFSSISNICENATPISITGGNPAGGFYFGAGISNGNLDPAAAGAGQLVAGYTFTSSFGCVDTAYDTIVIDTVPLVGFDLVTNVCADVDTVDMLNEFPVGGVFSGNHVFGNKFSVASSQTGIFSVNYTFTDGHGCTGDTTRQITVDTLPIVTFNATIDSICEYFPAPLDGVIPVGGVFSGIGVISDTLFTDDLQFNQTITYTFTDGNGCVASAEDSVYVHPDPGIVFTNDTIFFCPGDTVPLTFADPAGGEWISDFMDNAVENLIAPDSAYLGIGGIYSFGNVCGFDRDTFYLNVWPNPVPNLGPDSFMCNSTSLLLDPGTFASYVWNDGSVDSTYLLNGGPDTLQEDQLITVEVRSFFGCKASDSIFIQVEDNPAFNLGENISICSDSTLTLRVNANYATFTWSTGDAGTSAQVHNGNDSTGLSRKVWVTGQNPLGCSYSDSLLVTLDFCGETPPSPVIPRAAAMRIFPNPTWGGDLTVTFNTSNIDIDQITVQGMLGTAIRYTFEPSEWVVLDDNSIRLDISNLPGGTYVLKVKANGLPSLTEKIIVR